MTLTIIESAAAAGVHLATRNGQIELTAKERPDAQLLEQLRTHKAAVITELERLQWLWLERVAHLLQSTPEHLLQSGLIDDVDLLEQWRTEPRHAAALIQQAANSITETDRPEPPQVNTVNTPTREQTDSPAHILTAATASPDWLLARDQYMGHLMTCPACYAPTGRYCATGADLRQQYQFTPMEPTP